MSLVPKFVRFSGGDLNLGYSQEAHLILNARKNENRPTPPCLHPDIVKSRAMEDVKRKGGSTSNPVHLLGCYEVQFGAFRGKTFQWLLENGLGYVGWFVDSMRGEKPTDAPLSANKFAFKRYVESFPEGRQAVEMKRNARAQKQTSSSISKPMSTTATPTSPSTPTKTTSAFSSLLRGRKLSPQSLKYRVRRLMEKSPQKTSPAAASCPPQELEDEELISEVLKFEESQAKSKQPEDNFVVVLPPVTLHELVASTSTSEEASSTVHRETSVITDEIPLPEGWRKSLPKADHQWISKALFRWSVNGKPELDDMKIDRLWYYPPQPQLICNMPPRPDRYFSQRLLLWMPRRLWHVKLHCPQEDHKQELTSAGIYQHVRQVFDIDGYYSIATEYLECSQCKRKFSSWSRPLLKQLDVGHQLLFPVILTYRYACDVRVIRMMRERGLGNSSSQLIKKLGEQHHEAWLQKTAHYLSDCKGFVTSRLLQHTNPENPPAMIPLPKFRWLLTVYSQDIMDRLEEVKAAITSTFGRVLKIDSTKKVVKKLSGHGAGTASWCTNVGNEYGQVLISVLTAGEGFGLSQMVNGLIKRYEDAQVPPPELLYVDRDCCQNNQFRRMLAEWPDVIIRLDIWHFMRRISKACTTDAHQLYGIFMGRLSNCIFEWSKDDLDLLMEAKREELSQLGLDPSETEVYKKLTKKEMATHCRRKTRDAEVISELIQNLLETFVGDQGLDTLGVPLLDKDRVWEMWESQKRHVTCIQDPPGVQLYTRTSTINKGRKQLPVYRCARGSTSLESFHLHLNRFIPGNSANDMHFQCYLLEGLMRWNENRELAATATTGGTAEGQSYSGIIRHTVNLLSETVLGKKLAPEYRKPRKYTGELIGVEYLYSQTGEALQPSDPETEDEIEDDEGDEGFEEGEVDDQTIAPASSLIKKTGPTLSLPVDPEYEALRQSRPKSPQASAFISSRLSTSDQSSTEQEESVDIDNISGFAEVEALAQYLVDIRDQTRAISNEQAGSIIKLWQAMSAYDRRPTKFHQDIAPS